MKVSIIIPVFNIEKYIKRCLESVVNQTYKNLEIIIINDQTKDKSEEIIKEYLFDNRIRYVVNPENLGISATREVALKLVTGDYIMFVDGDDALEHNAVHELVEVLKEEKYDLISFNTNVINEFDETLKESFIGYSNQLDDRTNMLLGFQFTWNRIYKRELLEGIEFPKGLIYEDLATVPKIIEKAKKVKLVNKPFYKYRMRNGSITNSADSKAFDIYKVFELLYDYGMNKETGILSEEIELQIYLNLIFKFMSLRNIQGYKQRSKHLKLIKQGIKKYCPYKKKNKYYSIYMEDFVSGQKKLIIKLFNVPFFKHFIILFVPKGKRF